MGTRGWGTEIYQEGLRIPPLKIVEAGELDAKVMDIILTNTRTREMLENDLMSQISSVKVAADDVLAALPQVRQRDDAGVLRRAHGLLRAAHARGAGRDSRRRLPARGADARRRRQGRPVLAARRDHQARQRRDARLHGHRCADQGPHQQPARDHARGGVLRDALRHRCVDSEHRRLQAADHGHRAARHARQCALARPPSTSA